MGQFSMEIIRLSGSLLHGNLQAHQDKKGLNLDVEMIPMKPGRFVVREAKPKQKGEGH
jgi:hypothetical protein